MEFKCGAIGASEQSGLGQAHETLCVSVSPLCKGRAIREAAFLLHGAAVRIIWHSSCSGLGTQQGLGVSSYNHRLEADVSALCSHTALSPGTGGLKTVHSRLSLGAAANDPRVPGLRTFSGKDSQVPH